MWGRLLIVYVGCEVVLFGYGNFERWNKSCLVLNSFMVCWVVLFKEIFGFFESWGWDEVLYGIRFGK